MNSRSHPRKGERGFSLIEAVAAATLLAAAMMSLNNTSISLARGTKTADSYSAATALATEQLEILRAMPLGSAGHAPGNYASAGNPLQADGTAGGKYMRTWTVSANNNPANGLRTVVVTVSWTDTSAHSMQLAGYVRCATVPC
jgi:Tfp pilus assembly protein PilV